MTLLFFLALIGIFVGTGLARWTSIRIPFGMKQWFHQKPWVAGILVALGNIMILGITVLDYFFIYLHTGYSQTGSNRLSFLTTSLIFAGAPFLSVYVWMTFKYLVGGTFIRRFIVFLIGQSVYIGLFIYMMYAFSTMPSAPPGQDNFMQAVGYIFAMLICFGATLVSGIGLTSPMPKNHGD